jgi:hypothetical protein
MLTCGMSRRPTESCDRELEPADERRQRVHRHGRNPPAASRRDTFQISPQAAQRQYVLSSGLRAVLVIERDRHAGHMVGAAATSIPDRSAVPLPLR